MKSHLSKRISIGYIRKVIANIRSDQTLLEELYVLLFDEDDTVAYQAAWVFTHFNPDEIKWLANKQNALIDEALVCNHVGKRRLLLTLINLNPLPEPTRVDLLDRCLLNLRSLLEPPGIITLSAKLAFKMCKPYPELRQELECVLENMEVETSVPSIKMIKRKISRNLKELKKNERI
ncbi:hypothetical protein LJC68_00580 [Bacteroidales bacterium OttesenSCG-928-B11]|nr:hypothetical protein [Bacteroidales bacterium OttesenSCG-928-E04]MDL2311359.1 hypothetical protein [Bacteroidales bacterium OttesenSCG-928-B11]MDL2326027.1 hypothetical protein [Bacteroidales bacterium OttesenSCG-928-A14]